MKQELIYCGGQFISTQQKLDVISPFNQQKVYQTFLSGQTEYEESIKKAILIQKQLQDFPLFKRADALMYIAQKLLEQKEEFATILAQEVAKPMKYALVEVERASLCFQIASEEAKRLPKEYISLECGKSGIGKEAIIKYFPIGLVAGIAPFNFPLNLVAHKLAPSIASGCPIILKPASQAPISALYLAKLIDQTDLPKGSVSILPMDRQFGNQLVIDERFKLLTFTGSPVVGWEMKKNAGKKKVVLELGGNAGLIITKTADWSKLIAKIVVGAFSFSGQSCIHTQRILIQEEIFEDFCQQFIQQVQKLKSGDPMDLQTDLSAMIDEKNAMRIEKWVQDAVNSGAKLLSGGKRQGTYFEPTILTNTQNTMQVCFEEAFAPVVILEKYQDFQQAIEQVNNSQFGLQAGVLTNDLQEVYQAFDLLEVGGVVINDVPTFRIDNMPYGGIKDSGIGREGPKYAILDMMEPKMLILDQN